MDISDHIPHLGTTTSRGAEAIKFLKKEGLGRGTFRHNDVLIEVYPDSTDRELAYQYELGLCRLRKKN